MSKHSKDIQNYYDTNQSLWNQKTPIHLKSEMYDLENFLQGKTSLKEIELNALTNVKGKSIRCGHQKGKRIESTIGFGCSFYSSKYF